MASTKRSAPDRPDKDNPEWTETDFARARSGGDVLREMGVTPPRPRGRPVSDHPKQQVTMRLDQDVLEALKEDGKGWQTRANALLRDALHLDS